MDLDGALICKKTRQCGQRVENKAVKLRAIQGKKEEAKQPDNHPQIGGGEMDERTEKDASAEEQGDPDQWSFVSHHLPSIPFSRALTLPRFTLHGLPLTATPKMIEVPGVAKNQRVLK